MLRHLALSGERPGDPQVTKAPLLAQGQMGDGPQGKPNCPTLAGGGMPCPEFMSPEHLITDNNGDVYNFVYAKLKPSASMPCTTRSKRDNAAGVATAEGGKRSSAQHACNGASAAAAPFRPTAAAAAIRRMHLGDQ